MKKYWLLAITLIGWAITSYTLHYIQYNIYGGSIKTIWLYILVFVPTLLISVFLNDNEKTKKEPNKVVNIISWVISILMIVACVIANPYQAVIYNFIWISAISLFLYMNKSVAKKLKDEKFVKDRCIFVVLVYVCLIAEPFLFATITGANSINNVKDDLVNSGYENVDYIYNVSNKEFLDTLFETNIKLEQENELDLQSYIFTANEDKAVCVSVISGRILSEIKIEKNSSIEFLINYSKK